MAVLALDASVEADRSVLGGKAWGIVRMLALGVPVPPAFVLTTDECARYHELGGVVPEDVLQALPAAMAALEEATGTTFGGGERPLLVSVRSGAPTSMPGMMDTVLNLGMTPQVQEALAEITGDRAFAADVARRFAEQFEHVVGTPPPADPWEQLHAAMTAVFGSWRSRRAIAYRKDRGLPEAGGTAVTVQAMVFGNLDDASGTGVLFSRDPLTGAPEPYGEYLPRGQGEDVVSGSHDPLPLTALADRAPDLHRELLELAERLERDAADVQDIEFTVQSGRLWLLQTRSAKRSATAAVRLAVLLQREGLISPAEALQRVTPGQVAALLRMQVDPAARAGARLLASGRPAAPGVVSGVIVTDVDEAEDRALDGEAVILARPTTNPDDVHAMAAVNGIVTEVGGATSHAAVVSRELDTACVVGCGLGTVTALAGRIVTLDADSGELLEGTLPTITPSEDEDPDLARMKAWAVEAGGTGHTLAELLRSCAQVP
ncbi:MAG: Pyruvate, phosphate dikinase [Solirubrobacterales bacterium]|nr:Pyruvate, phosphate dikinase [Solirubrobacterales bacterium]